MPTARKLPSGSWRCQVFSHTEEIIQTDGTIKKKRIYESFTSDVPGPKGKRIAEQMAAEFAANKESHKEARDDFTFEKRQINISKTEKLYCLPEQLWIISVFGKMTSKR